MKNKNEKQKKNLFFKFKKINLKNTPTPKN